MHILFLAPHPFFQHRGTPLADRAVIEFLTSEGHRVDVLTYHEGESVELPRCRIYRIGVLPGVRQVRPGFSLKKLACDLAMWRLAWRMTRATQYDLLHAVEEAAFIATALSRRFRVPYVYDMDSSLAEQLTERYRPLRLLHALLVACERAAVRRSLAVLAACPALAELARTYAPNHLIGCVEDTTLLDMGAATPQPTEGFCNGPVVMYVGNLEPYQGIDLLLDGFARVAAEMKTAQLVIVGGAPRNIGRYRKRARRLGIAHRVRFLGPRPVEALPGYLRQADVLVSPRLGGRNTPMKLYSYLDSGRPVVATRLPTHTQLVSDEIARLVEPRPEALAEGIVELLRHPERGEALAARAKDLIQRHYTPTAARTKLAAFYGEVISRLQARARDP